MVIARFWAATGITSVTSKLGTSTPPIRFMNGCLVVGMRENCFHEIVEHLGIGRHRPARVGVHVPGGPLVQRRGLLVGEVQDVAPCGAAPRPAPARSRSAVQDLLEHVRQVPRPADGVVLRAADREIHVLPCQWRVAGEIFSRRPFLARNRCHAPSSSPPGFVPERVVTNDDLAKIMDTSDEWITQRSGIKTRHWVSDGETGATLARRAALQALT